VESLLDQLRGLMQDDEGEHLEFKEAKTDFDSRKLVGYCAALANEGGGKLVLGVTNRKPRRVVGTQAFSGRLTKAKQQLLDRLHLRIEVDDIPHSDGRVLVFHVPSRPIGMPIACDGVYWMRSGDRLVHMTQDQLKRIFDEAGPDFSAEICAGASLADLDGAAIESFRSRWLRKSASRALVSVTQEQLLGDAELLVNGRVTYAALILFGKREAMGKHLSQAEVLFEYRSDEAAIACQQRRESREGFFAYCDELWDTINTRNDVQHFSEGLFVWDIPTFNEEVVREGILNAVAHRDYRLGGSVFVRQFPRKLEITSPGGFPPGVTPENILFKQMPRNRRICEAFQRCGLVERSGQGADKMFRAAIQESKPVPAFGGSDDYQVALTLRGDIQDPPFLRFLEKVGAEKLASFSIEDFLLIDQIHRDQPVPESLKGRIPRLDEAGVIEKVGRGRGTRYILSQRFYGFLDKKGVYTRRKGLDRNTNKELLLKHIRDNEKEGSRFRDLAQVLPSLTRNQLKGLLQELKAEKRIYPRGHTKAGRWYPGPDPDHSTSKTQ
jgi:ATP-dependent DNA helicase RecG